MTGEELPKARVRRRRPGFRSMWVVPMVAAAVAGPGSSGQRCARSAAPRSRSSSGDGGGLRVGQTPVKYRGVVIGEVSGVQLSRDHNHVLVRTRLQRAAANARARGRGVLDRAAAGRLRQCQGLNTVLSGPEIQVLPPQDEDEPKRYEFAGLDSAPVGAGHGRAETRPARPSGRGRSGQLAGASTAASRSAWCRTSTSSRTHGGGHPHLIIYERYAGLVRPGSAFWDTSGINVTGGLLKGIEVDSSRCAPCSPAASSSPRRARRRRASSPARSSSCTTSRRTSGSPGCRGSGCRPSGIRGVRISSRAASPGARPSPSPSRGSPDPRIRRATPP